MNVGESSLGRSFARRHPQGGQDVLVQREMESGRNPLVGKFRPLGGDFQGMRVYRSDLIEEESEEVNSAPSKHRLDEPARLSLGMGASPQSPLPFHPAKSL